MSLDVFGEHNGAAEETRTPDPIITNDVLYQLSYSGTFWFSFYYGPAKLKSTPQGAGFGAFWRAIP